MEKLFPNIKNKYYNEKRNNSTKKKLYPQCSSGILPPFVTAHGLVIPCCMQTYHEKNEFTISEHSLYNYSFGEIINGESWKNMINSLEKWQNPRCLTYCTSKDKRVPFDPDDTIDYNKNFSYDDLEIIQIETTNTCTLKCQYCRRQLIPYRLNKDHLPVDMVMDVLNYKHWKEYIDCALYGDPIWYKYNFELLDRIIKKPTFDKFYLHLAATGRGKDYWDKIIKKWGKLQQRGVDITIQFGIDGDKETSKMHRVNQDWDEITYAVKRLTTTTDIPAVIQFIPFKHNEHQVDYMYLLAEKLGARLLINCSPRFIRGDPNIPTMKEYFYDYQSILEKD